MQNAGRFSKRYTSSRSHPIQSRHQDSGKTPTIYCLELSGKVVKFDSYCQKGYHHAFKTEELMIDLMSELMIDLMIDLVSTLRCCNSPNLM